MQDYILEKLHQKNSLLDLAEIVGMSERNFTRIFKKETGITVVEYINVVRKAKATELKKNPNFSKIEIANKVGLQSEKQLTRILTNPSK